MTANATWRNPRAGWGAVGLLVLAGSASAGEHAIAFTATPINCEDSGNRKAADLDNAGGQRLTWADPNTLHVESLQGLSSYAEIVPGSGTLDDSVPGALQFRYAFKDPGPEPGQPYDMCGQLFIIEFSVSNISRADYSVSVKGSEVK